MSADEYGRIVVGERVIKGEKVKGRKGGKVKGIRDQRDKTGKGNGRVKDRWVDD